MVKVSKYVHYHVIVRVPT